jgi:hypothetical protein
LHRAHFNESTCHQYFTSLGNRALAGQVSSMNLLKPLATQSYLLAKQRSDSSNSSQQTLVASLATPL